MVSGEWLISPMQAVPHYLTRHKKRVLKQPLLDGRG